VTSCHIIDKSESQPRQYSHVPVASVSCTHLSSSTAAAPMLSTEGPSEVNLGMGPRMLRSLLLEELR
jgi:hypothetical protein